MGRGTFTWELKKILDKYSENFWCFAQFQREFLANSKVHYFWKYQLQDSKFCFILLNASLDLIYQNFIANDAIV